MALAEQGLSHIGECESLLAGLALFKGGGGDGVSTVDEDVDGLDDDVLSNEEASEADDDQIDENAKEEDDENAKEDDEDGAAASAKKKNGAARGKGVPKAKPKAKVKAEPKMKAPPKGRRSKVVGGKNGVRHASSGLICRTIQTDPPLATRIARRSRTSATRQLSKARWIGSTK